MKVWIVFQVSPLGIGGQIVGVCAEETDALRLSAVSLFRKVEAHEVIEAGDITPAILDAAQKKNT